MKKAKVYIFIYLSMMLPVFLLAAPIDKYYVPPIQFQQQASQQQIPNARAQTGESAVYDEFRKKVKNLSQEEIGKLKSSFTNKMKTASDNGKFDEAKYYQELINILNKS